MLPSKIGRRAARFSISWTLAAALAGGATAFAGEGFSTSWIDVDTGEARHRFTVELARSPAERAQGLQHRQSLPADRAMLFDFGETAPVYMWMKNTPISLDMAFVSASGRVAGVAHETEPYSLATIASPVPVRYVVEFPGGTAKRIGLEAGDRILGPPMDGG